MKLRMHYLDEHGDAVSHDYHVSQQDLRGHLDRFARVTAEGGMIHQYNASDYVFSVPASRVLLLEEVQ